MERCRILEFVEQTAAAGSQKEKWSSLVLSSDWLTPNLKLTRLPSLLIWPRPSTLVPTTVPGSYSSALAIGTLWVSAPPVTSTIPFSRRDAAWSFRMVLRLPVKDQALAAG